MPFQVTLILMAICFKVSTAYPSYRVPLPIMDTYTQQAEPQSTSPSHVTVPFTPADGRVIQSQNTTTNLSETTAPPIGGSVTLPRVPSALPYSSSRGRIGHPHDDPPTPGGHGRNHTNATQPPIGQYKNHSSVTTLQPGVGTTEQNLTSQRGRLPPGGQTPTLDDYLMHQFTGQFFSESDIQEINSLDSNREKRAIDFDICCKT